MRPGFTLIELLVVISLIAILACMLLPAIRAVSDAAKGQRCRGNLRQIGIGANLYADDNEFYPPAIWWHSDGVGDRYWMGFLAPYVEGNKTFDSGSINQIRTTSVMYGCPLFKPVANTPTSVGYGMTPYPNAPARETINQADEQPVNTQGFVYRLYRPGDISHATQRPYVADSTNWSLPASSLNRHRGRQNTLYFDLHVGAMTYLELAKAVNQGTLFDL